MLNSDKHTFSIFICGIFWTVGCGLCTENCFQLYHFCHLHIEVNRLILFELIEKAQSRDCMSIFNLWLFVVVIKCHYLELRKKISRGVQIFVFVGVLRGIIDGWC